MPTGVASSTIAGHIGMPGRVARVTLAFVAGLLTAPVSIHSALAADRQSALSGSVLDGGRRVDPRGMSTLTPDRRRTPTGLLYPYPARPPPWRGEEGDPVFRGYAELGWLWSVGEVSEARFREYFDPGDGPWLRRFGLEARALPGLDRVVVEGGSVARDDAFYRAEIRQTGRFRLSASYDALEHTYANDARVLFSGVGGERLNLPRGLVPGDNSRAEIAAALDGVERRIVSQSTNETRIDLHARLTPRLDWTAAYRLDRRDGERPHGGTLGLTFGETSAGSVVETLEPIHSRLHEGSTGLELRGESLQANLAYRISHFDNRRQSLTWENPFAAVDLGFLVVPGEPLGRAALAPDNTSHRLSADVASRTPLDGRFTASVVWTRMEQDERLIPATINSSISDFDDLSRNRADARVDRLQIGSRWRVRPIRPLTLSIGGHFSQRDNDTNYRSRNPTTDVYGYVVEDLAATNRVGAVPFSHRRWSVEADGQWRLTPTSKLGLEVEHESFERSNRARRVTRDNLLRIHLSTRALPDSTLRVAYEFHKRSGSEYKPDRDREYYAPAPGSSVLAGPARSLASFRQYDLARYSAHIVDVRSNWLVGTSADVSLSGRVIHRDYGAEHGVQNERLAELTLDGTLQPSPEVDLHAFASFEWRTRRLDTINSVPGSIGDLSPGGTTFPFSNRWSWDSDTRTFALGFGVRVRPLESISLDVDYRFQASDESIDTGFDPSGGALTSISDPATAPTSYPNTRLRDHFLQVSAVKDWSEVFSTTLVYWLQSSEIEDRQQRGIQPLVNQNLLLGVRDDDFTAHVIGLTATLRR